MRRILLTILGIALLIFPVMAAPGDSPEEQIGEAWSMSIQTGVLDGAGSVNVLNSPGAANDVVGTLKPGETIRILEQQDGWMNIEWQGGAAFVQADSIRIVDTPADSTVRRIDSPEPVPPPAAATPVTSGTRVLLIGDSHSVGVYGSELDKLFRQTGASVRSVGSSGASPSWFWNNTVTKSGYVDRRADGSKDQPKDWRTPRATPAFRKLLNEHHPELVVISLGANMLGASRSVIERDCGRLVDEARNAGARVFWVGPPDARSSATNSKRDTFYSIISQCLNGRATVIDSRRFTKYPASGGDGVHYWGTEGMATARKWAAGVLQEIKR